MPRTKNIVPVNPKVLIWARESIGLSPEDAAQALKVPVQTLSDWESGAAGVGITELRTIAAQYKRPVAALLQPMAPPLPALPEDFRTVEGKGPSFTVETRVAIRDAQRIRDLASELIEDDPTLFPTPQLPQASLTDSSQESGLLERDTFGIDIDTQLHWSNVNQAFNAWRARMQQLGIITLVKPMARGDCRGFSLYQPGAIPIIVVNGREADQAKIFTLFHEYAHLALNREGLCLEKDEVSVERWCNTFSASLLVPQNRLRLMASGPVSSTNDVQDLAWRFKVSRHVIALRLGEINLAFPGLYGAILAEDRERFDWEKPEVPEDEEYGGRPQDAVRLSEVGAGFADIVLTALERGRITPVDASEFLDMRPDKLEALAKRVGAVKARHG